MQQNIPLKNYTTFGIGGSADFFSVVTNLQELQAALRFSQERGIPYFILGKGSNSLFSDKGFRGLVILNKIDTVDHDGHGGFIVGAGHSFSFLGIRTARDGWGGLEFASGIPATVGGAIYMNAGAQKGETKDTLVWVDYLHQNGLVERFLRDELSFGYRSSSFQSMKGVIVGAAFKLQRDDMAKQRQIELLEYRMKTQPYRDKSAGCVFKNPAPLATACYSAGYLIEQAGCKGLQVGGASVSTMHANFLVNAVDATAQEIMELVHEVQKRVYERTGTWLECELRALDEYGNQISNIQLSSVQ